MTKNKKRAFATGLCLLVLAAIAIIGYFGFEFNSETNNIIALPLGAYTIVTLTVFGAIECGVAVAKFYIWMVKP